MDLSLNNIVTIVAVNAVLTGLLMAWYAYGNQFVITDSASSRSLHQGKAVTGAGILMFIPLCLTMVIYAPTEKISYLLLFMSLLGFADDRFDLSFKIRLLIQLAIMGLSLFELGVGFGGMFVFLLISSIWWINLFNFMDGANGMAGFHALTVMSFYGYVFYQDTSINYILASAVTVVLVYLFFNVYLRKLFMGDSGSLPLAMFLTILAILAIRSDILNYYQVAIVHAVFIVDATLTLIHRIIKRENITHAHASHLYQRLIKAKHSHLKISLLYAGITLLMCIVALAISQMEMGQHLIVMLSCYFVLIMIFMKNLTIGR